MKFKAWFANRPVHVKLSLINILVVLSALLPIITITLGSEYYAVRQASLREAEVQADIIRDNVTAAMAFNDRDSANEILHALRASPDILQAVLFLPDGAVLSRYVHSGALKLLGSSSEDRSDRVVIEQSSILVFRQVYLKEQWVGELVTESSLEGLYQRVRLYLTVNFLSTLLGFAIAYPLSLRLKESITAPLTDLMNLAKHVTTHQDYAATRSTNERQDEIGSLSRAFDKMLENINERDLKLSQMAYYDNVTGLNNRHYFMERLDQVVGNALRYGKRACLMFIDLDDFKQVNDTFGHDVGDSLLREVAAQLTGVLRDSDVVCRLGGDEFAVIIENINNLAGLEVLARKIVASLSTPMHLHGHQVTVGASVGISLCPEHAENVTDLLKTADIAMYQAKEGGKNRYCLYGG
jgi:diguanylate cyclase (GGDEF)-like protein